MKLIALATRIFLTKSKYNNWDHSWFSPSRLIFGNFHFWMMNQKCCIISDFAIMYTERPRTGKVNKCESLYNVVFLTQFMFSSRYLMVSLGFKKQCWISKIINRKLTVYWTAVQKLNTCGETKEPIGIWSFAPVVIPLFSNPLLYCLHYFGCWGNKDKGAIFTGKYWTKHDHKTLRHITVSQFNKGSYKLPLYHAAPKISLDKISLCVHLEHSF